MSPSHNGTPDPCVGAARRLAVNAQQIYRFYKILGLQLRSKTSKRRVKAKLRDDRRPAVQAKETWAMDFVRDQLGTGRKIRVLTMVDEAGQYLG